MKLGLGTAQFGMHYGISNAQGACSKEEVAKILFAAASHHVSFLDTAPAYNNSEFILGELCRPDWQFNIVTKIPNLQNTLQQDKAIRNSLHSSLANLRIKTVYGLLVHNADDLIDPVYGQQTWETMLELKAQGLVKKIGASVYTAEQIERLMNVYAIDLIQLPINVFDQRLLQKGHLVALKKMGVEIHARSIFLQGLMLMQLNDIPDFFNPIKANILSYHQWLSANNMTQLQAALHFIAGIKEIDIALVGVNNLQHLQEILSYNSAANDLNDFSQFAVDIDKMIDPSQWQLSSALIV